MSWLDTVIEKGSTLMESLSCDPPWNASNDWPLKKRPPGIVSTYQQKHMMDPPPPYDPEEPMFDLYIPENPGTLPCKGWFTREYLHTSAKTGKKVSVAKWYNANTGKTTWTVIAGGLDIMKVDFPELYKLLAPLPENVKVEPDPDFAEAPPEELEKYINEIGSEDPDVPAAAKPGITQNLARAGFQWWHGALLVGGLLFAGTMYGKKKKKKRGKRKKR